MKSESRMLLAVAASVLIFYTWGKFFAPPPPPANVVAPAAVATTSSPFISPPPPILAMSAQDSKIPIETTVLENDKVIVRLSNEGAIPVSWQLKHYLAGDKAPHPIDLVTSANTIPLRVNLADFGLEVPAKAHFRHEIDAADRVVYRWRNDQIELTKTYSLSKGGYEIYVDVAVHNVSSAPLQGRVLLGWETEDQVPKSGGFGTIFRKPQDRFTPLYYLDNGVVRDANPKTYAAGKTIEGNLAWAGIENRYFFATVIPQEQSEHSKFVGTYQSPDDVTEHLSTFVGAAPLIIPAGQQVQQSFRVYVGPKEIEALKSMGGVHLDEAINYGYFSLVAVPILYLLKFFYQVIHNYGVAIILLTLFIKLLLHPITKASMKSMRRMQELQPQLKSLREKYQNDKERLNIETMQLFRLHKVNPLGGCLPMVVQIPIYIALYKVLWNSIELYRAPFFGFYRDLSGPDPYFIAPVLLGVAFFLQQHLTPSPTVDPAQKKAMMIMPVMFTGFMFFLPSGLVIYILVNTLFSVLQQWLMNRGLGFRDLLRGRLTPRAAG